MNAFTHFIYYEFPFETHLMSEMMMMLNDQEREEF